MRFAVIDIVGEMLADSARVVLDAGLKIEGSLSHGFDASQADQVRLVVRDEAGTILPQQCEAGGGWWLVNPAIVQESYGKQTIARLGAIAVVGKLEFGVDGTMKVVPQ